MLLRFWEGLLWSDHSKFCDVHKWGEWFPSSLPGSRYSCRKAVRLGLRFSYCSLKKLGLPADLVLLSWPLCPDHSSCSSPAHRSRETTAGRAEGSASPASVSCLPLMQRPATIPMLSKRLTKNRCHATNSRSINHYPQWLSLQTLFFKLMFWHLLWFLLCSVSEFQQVEDNKIPSLAQLVINSI